MFESFRTVYWHKGLYFYSFLPITYRRHKGWTRDKQKKDKEIPFPNICANILLEAKTLCANHFFLNENRKLKWLHKTKIKLQRKLIILANNGRMFSSKRTKHIDHRYFLNKDKVDRGELEV